MKKSQLTLWYALGSSPENWENEKWPSVPFGVLGHSYFRIRTTNVAKAIINDIASYGLISPSPFDGKEMN